MFVGGSGSFHGSGGLLGGRSKPLGGGGGPPSEGRPPSGGKPPSDGGPLREVVVDFQLES